MPEGGCATCWQVIKRPVTGPSTDHAEWCALHPVTHARMERERLGMFANPENTPDLFPAGAP